MKYVVCLISWWQFVVVVFVSIIFWFVGFPVSLGRLWVSCWGSFGVPRSPKGFSLASLWLPFGSLGTPWDHLGHLGLPRGAWDDFGSKMDVQFRANRFQVALLRIKSDLAELSPRSPLNEGSGRSGARAAAPNPTSLAPGARMTWV